LKIADLLEKVEHTRKLLNGCSGPHYCSLWNSPGFPERPEDEQDAKNPKAPHTKRGGGEPSTIMTSWETLNAICAAFHQIQHSQRLQA